ncbi:MAG TPA: sodium:proton antiporter [Acidobacteriota bacterium]|nr:sodium:proton antiporter [Acidobacteriota bacterium]
MSLFETIAVLITLAALFSYLNFRYIKLPNTIGIMLIALLGSALLIVLSSFGYHLEDYAQSLLETIDFDETLLQGMLAFLLFAGALHINLSDLASQKYVIGWMASIGVVVSTVLVGTFTWIVVGQVGFEISFLYCLLFGALISPTDPIAVLSILKKVGVPKSLETKICGESLFNDGVGVVIFLVLFELLRGGQEFTVSHVATLFLTETAGGAIFGLAIGYVAYKMLKSVDNYQVEVLITLALVTGGYALASKLHLSGPIAMVVAGLLIGNHGRMFAMSETTSRNLDTFWELTDEILNAVLFLLIGLEVLVLKISWDFLLVAIALIPLVLLSRWISVSIPVTLFRYFRKFTPGVIRILTWGGLRGGISVALALSLPPGKPRDLFLTATYVIVVFSIAIQGLTIGGMVNRLTRHRNTLSEG